jgi:hypothetical protein
MRERTIQRLIAEFGPPEIRFSTPDPHSSNYRWSLPPGRDGLRRINIAVNNWSQKNLARVWIFNPFTDASLDRVVMHEVKQEADLDALCQRVHAGIAELRQQASKERSRLRLAQ